MRNDDMIHEMFYLYFFCTYDEISSNGFEPENQTRTKYGERGQSSIEQVSCSSLFILKGNEKAQINPKKKKVKLFAVYT